MADEVVVVEESDDVEFEMGFASNESGKLDVGEIFAFEESGAADALELLGTKNISP